VRIVRADRANYWGPPALLGEYNSMQTPTMENNTVVHQCPYCELRFAYMNEVKDHVILDHPEHARVVETAEPHELPH
jgi:hypothetical protein